MAFFQTWNSSGKVKRLRRTSTVEIAPSNIRGRPLGPPVKAKAVLLAGEAAKEAAQMLARKYPVIHGWLIPWYYRMRGGSIQQYRLEPPGS